MGHKPVTVIKMNGEEDVFDASKLRYSLERSGAKEESVDAIMHEINEMLYNGISTKEIYNRAFSLLRRHSRPTAARYKLKKAILELGPTGYPFEKFVGEIFSFEGYRTQVGVIVQGECISHEVDILAEKKGQRLMIECKFHADQGRNCDIKVPLYIHSRFNDVQKQWIEDDNEESISYQGCIVTNTRFSTDAMQYGDCSNLMLIGWDHPKKGSLKSRIDLSGLHPITCLTTLTNAEKKSLLDKEKVLCNEICRHPELLDSIGVSEKRQKNILKEARALCRTEALSI